MIKLMADSACDLEQTEADALGIALMPLSIRFGSEEYWDGVTLSHREFFEKLIETDEIPQTSQISDYRFEEAFASLTADGSEVIAVTLSSKLSGTHACAVRAAKKFPGKVYVVDSMNACLGERILVDYALRLIREGNLSAPEIAAELDEKKNKIQLLAVLDTLKFLRKGDRISPFERLHQAVVLLRRKFREPGCIHSADDDLLHHTHLLCTPLLYLSSLASFLFIQNAQ